MRFYSYFHELGYSEKAAKIWLALYELSAPQSASVIADRSGFERTYTYKVLTDLSSDGLIATSERNGIKYFSISDARILLQQMQERKIHFEKLERGYATVESELKSLRRSSDVSAPRISTFEWSHALTSMYEDMIRLIDSKSYISVLFFASNTLESRTSSENTLSRYAAWFLGQLQERHVYIDARLGNGVMLLESIGRAKDISEISNLPASDSAIQVWIVGDVTYIVLFQNVPFALKLESRELTSVLRFLMEKAK